MSTPLNARIERLMRPEVLALSAYHVADPGNMIKLDAMENPYPWPTELQQQWLQELQHCSLNRYPDPEAKALAARLRHHNGIADNCGMVLGNGSDEIIQLLQMALLPGSCVLAPTPGFVMYKQIALSLGLRFCGVPLTGDDFSLDLPAMLAAIETEQPALIFLAYPNNPTGNLFDRHAMQAIVEAAPGLVVVDEAYAPFADASFIDQLSAYPHLLVMRTVSKLGLAGLRLGFMAGDPLLIEQFNKVRLPYNINVLTQASAAFALEHADFLQQQTHAICQSRGEVMAALHTLDTVMAYPSAANFILLKTLRQSADAVFASLKQQGILIKNLSPQGGVLTNCLRVTIGQPSENQAFLHALQYALATV